MMDRVHTNRWAQIIAFISLLTSAATYENEPSLRRVVPAEFNQLIRNNISASDDGLLRLKYVLENSSHVVRVWVHSYNATLDNPLLVAVRRSTSILSWQVPLPLDNRYYYDMAARTLCPSEITDLISPKNESSNVTFYVEFSSSDPKPVMFEVNASLVSDFMIGLGESRHLNISPSQPQFFGFVVPEGMDSVFIHVRSNDTRCLVVSIQDTKCPVFDLDTNVLSIGTFQTMTTKVSLAVQRSTYQQFFLVFVLKPDDFSCANIANVIPATNLDYGMAVGVTLAAFLGFYLISLLLFIYFVHRDNHDEELQETKRRVLESLANASESTPLGSPNRNVPSYGAINSQPGNGHNADHHAEAPHEDNAAGPSVPGPNRRKSHDDEIANVEDGLEPHQEDLIGASDEYDQVPDAKLDKDVIRTKANLMVADLSRKSYKKLNQKYSMYHWNLITISIFYTLPVIQLVITYQSVVSATGNEDLCYYNFECARPLFKLFAFNTVFSNIGYVLFGLLFIIIVRIKDIRHQHRMKENEILETKFGVPRHYGLFYAMGVALVMEGVLSGSYHICPNYTNFQFDTAFMYMIAAICLLKIYQIRHPDINAHSHVAYAVMALVILIAVIGVIYNSLAFWIVFSITYIVLMFLISAEFYYKSQWKIDRYIFRRLHQEWCTGRGWRKLFPTYPDRMIYLVLSNGMNLAFIIWGLIERPKAFAGFLIVVFISNLMLYMIFYVLMKLRHRERLKLRATLLVVVACAAWGGSCALFLQERTSWMKTPAQSRELNDRCVLLGFYDTHDIWHFLSSFALFVSFMVTLTMDDDLMYTPQDQIAVF